MYVTSRKKNLEFLAQLGSKSKSRETREQLKSCETREVAFTCRYTNLALII